MKNVKTAKQTTSSRPKKSTKAERAKAREVVETTADRIAKMTPAKRRELIAKVDRLSDEFSPTLESAESDLLAVLQAVGLEFVRRYYPDATDASFNVSRYRSKQPKQEYHARIAMALPGDSDTVTNPAPATSTTD